MKLFICKALYFSLFAAALSTFSGCSASDLNVNGAGEGIPQKSGDYPPIATAIAQAEIKNLDGTTFKLEDKKGKVVLLNLWATWCGPCRSEMPALVKMQNDLGDRGLEIIGLNADNEPADKINGFARELSINYPLVYPDTIMQTKLLDISQFGGIPQSFLIDREGRLRGVFRGANPNDVRKMIDVVTKLVNEGAEQNS